MPILSTRRQMLGLAGATVFTTRASAHDGRADLQLVLAVDASGSVNQYRFELQKQGYAAAFRNRDVQRAIQSGPNRAIAISLTQWTGPSMQDQSIPWMLIGSPDTSVALAARIGAMPRRLYSGGTSISGAIDHALRLFPTCPFPADRRVIDISGDGSNNRGRPVTEARDEAVAAGIRINGLPILELERSLDAYYRASVIGGDGAFVIAVDTYEQFADAIVRKLILEISDATPTRRI